MRPELPLLLLAVAALAVHLLQDIVSRRVHAVPLPRVTQAVPRGDWPANPGTGRHRRGAPEPDAWLACHTTSCAHLTTAHTRTPAGLVCDECGTPNQGVPVHNDTIEEEL
ncbi:hypothetical protein OHA91_22945 [Streptomyces erythrochromogenes]|uniref:Secreted protein n=1 Tax=Streptomyces erythrochromogenes TaxID=285574 RepID=A0ABZ1QER3_9ACTN|nr:hypothetical protein [Streptomyces erythrochromogenes]